MAETNTADFGYIAISRKAYETDLFWNEERVFSRWEAWEDLIQSAAWAGYERIVGTHLIRLERGEVLASVRFLANRWDWGTKKVSNFLGLLVQMGRIALQRGTPEGNIYLLTKYDTYQNVGNSKATRRQQQGNSSATPGQQQRDSQATARQQLGNNEEPSKPDEPREPHLSCVADPCGDAPPEEPVEFWIPIKGLVPVKPNRGPVRTGENGTEFGLTASYVAGLVESFPGVDVRQKLTEIIRWNVRNESRRKTYPAKNGGVLEHIEGWLAREQNSGRSASDRRAVPERRLPVGLDENRRSQLDRLKEARNQ